MNKTRLIMTFVCAGVAFAGSRLLAQDSAPQQEPAAIASQGLSNEELKLLRKDVRSQKKQIIAANLDLTDTEAQQFWPIYDRYTAEMIKIVDKKVEVIKEY